ncbi:hypothetical protein IQA49_01950 [Leptospira borgpetersenii serovar Ballum]|uniref:Uncharacterized protein n=2 Tax=Leptospira borgpetersenii TaxID=174 RepID=A0A0S2IVG4_LEPBO|nr:hypothetical protein LBBP_03454 [Leptospira borgpetersenii serovar Ballum]ANH01916.1 Uncharacterized protein LB4E_2708 [Leptospira borgpetersenii str. 4E]EKQ99489.1 hypothetical protein LEP1GSC121_1861 [Leptospira borgpetersenii serovar Castellonis str. 200801910]EMO09139.1 hypothetical protein LEP1GSC137_2805 [Leptospira borgpetersenii str. Noumea 25]MBF3372539.1 hypothetical protein [Leptospira borgpetersenii serovar Arborea]QHH51297.1 hypothetical protein GS516_15185 [Leptospira borgpete
MKKNFLKAGVPRILEFVRRESFKSESIVRFFKPETKEFVSFIKYRGMGDCGKYFRYGLSEDEKPILKEVHVKLECDGTYSYTSDEIPLEWTEISVDSSFGGGRWIRTF